MPQGTRDYYEIVGVERSATPEEIKKAFRRRARELHPDVNSAPDAEDRFKELNEAYDVLSDEAKRDQYDRFGTVGRATGGPAGGYQYVDLNDIFGGGFGMGDIFSSFFGGVSGAQTRGVRREGRDMSIAITVTLEEAGRGVEKEIALDHLATCDVCGGSGSASGAGVTPCKDCNGSGQRVVTQQTFLGAMQTATPCTTCGATGSVVEDPCEECQGSGRVPDRQHVTVKVPAGIRDGQQIRLRGMGEAGIRNASAGDLLISVRIAQHEYLHREGDDLHGMATVNITQAALGTEIEVPGLLETETVHIPAGTQHADSVRVRGKGMPRLNSSARGDLILHVSVVVPKKLTKRQKELLTELSAELGEPATGERSVLEKLKDWLVG